ncbi:MAG: BrnA antitoxin family protein [Hyphomicrobiales bacterium]|nr:BrnA antitoxin family protein [Hyphomicrobiales bacterium]MDE2017190.1 BrnA antitoxin family protein [Hyphomicrobiales bacterium]
MNANAKNTRRVWTDADDAPDLSTEPWSSKIAETPARRGRPPSARRKILKSIRFDEDAPNYFQAHKSGWQTRINAALSKLAARK